MALSDCYMLRDVQTMANETILNVYFYQDLLLESIAQNVVEAWVTDMLPLVKAIQTNNINHEKVDAVNLADPSNFYEAIVNELGDTFTEVLPAHDAVNYSLRINSRALRPGSKRYAAIPENATSGNLFVSGSWLTAAEALRVQQSEILMSGVVATFQPIVIKRVQYNPDPSDLTHFAYRLPVDDSEFVFGNVISALMSNRVSHQVSRNNGR